MISEKRENAITIKLGTSLHATYKILSTVYETNCWLLGDPTTGYCTTNSHSHRTWITLVVHNTSIFCDHAQRLLSINEGIQRWLSEIWEKGYWASEIQFEWNFIALLAPFSAVGLLLQFSSRLLSHGSPAIPRYRFRSRGGGRARC